MMMGVTLGMAPVIFAEIGGHHGLFEWFPFGK